MQAGLEGAPGQAPGHIQAPVPSATFLTEAQCPAGPRLGLEDGPPAKRGRRAVFFLDPWLSSEHPPSILGWKQNLNVGASAAHGLHGLHGLQSHPQPSRSARLLQAPVCIQPRCPAPTDPERETHRCYSAVPRPPPPHPSPPWSFPDTQSPARTALPEARHRGAPSKVGGKSELEFVQ